MSDDHYDALPEIDDPDLEREFSLAHPEVHWDEEPLVHTHVVGGSRPGKRIRSPSPSPTPQGNTVHNLAVPSGAYLGSEAYSASRFGEVGEHMRKKRLKQKVHMPYWLRGFVSSLTQGFRCKTRIYSRA
jgi:hypothetical protein